MNEVTNEKKNETEFVYLMSLSL